MADKNSFVLFLENKEVFDMLPDEDCAALIRGIFQYETDGTEPELSLAAKCVFVMIKQQLDRNREKYEEKSRVRSGAGKKSAEARANKKGTNSTNVNFVEQKGTNSTDSDSDSVSVPDNVPDNVSDNVSESVSESVSVSVSDKERESKREKRTRFSPPSHDDIRDYCAQKGISIDPDAFIDYYGQQNWKLSNGNKMTDWKAAVRNWARRDKPRARSGTGEMSKEEYLASWGLAPDGREL